MARKKSFLIIFAALVLVVVLMVIVIGRVRNSASSTPAEPVSNTAPVSAAEPVSPSEVGTEPAVQPAIETGSGRQAGERFEDVIILEGMEETVKYEHIRNDDLGFEMDYDYESFERHMEPDREWFVSCWDLPENPENYLEVRYSPLDAETAAAAVSETLSKDYEISRDDSFPLDSVGTCIRIDASEVKGGGWMPDHLQAVYVIPAADGCRVATAHASIEASEGFLRRFRYMMNTFYPVAGQQTLSIPGTWQTASMSYASDGSMQPEYYVRFAASDILYGHLKDGQFVLDHADKIVSLEGTASGGFKVQSQSTNNVQYTFQTSESDNTVLEYYETWSEDAFPDAYRGGASLSRSN